MRVSELAVFANSGRYATTLRQFPTGKWGFCGSVPAALATNENGRTRVWDSKEAALASAGELGVEVSV